ncbi:hypothetical protein PTSG_11620 [Salpingoeca rosetta]|uniref:Secreted protein n=1 Tax=Salpingoeca rosetta (strain ATCC 50818 / BSB-021) TaxID=946362 RepID=F2TX06_SALR5|nr:uncharacterized protein PTSG_11620 [Salpingoeca rosetta]EGD75915.1 hypothetical protein PTSG_11620 [Salpingoeca rosetta]|eukprot:XP_004998091.1 hypothetical protein PTSG_11620 [Salpingoeca rosetta]
MAHARHFLPALLSLHAFISCTLALRRQRGSPLLAAYLSITRLLACMRCCDCRAPRTLAHTSLHLPSPPPPSQPQPAPPPPLLLLLAPCCDLWFNCCRVNPISRTTPAAAVSAATDT